MSHQGWHGIRLSSSHAPHLINQVDAQRLFIATAAPRRAQADTSPLAADSISCAAPPTLEYTPACAGRSFGSNWRSQANTIFLYAMYRSWSLEKSQSQIGPISATKWRV